MRRFSSAFLFAFVCFLPLSFFSKETKSFNEILSGEDVKLLAEMSLCPTATPADVCKQSFHSAYRSISGICNNRLNPGWGAADTALVRWLPAEYEDEEGEPKGWNKERLYNGFPLPPVRRVSSEILRSSCQWKDEDYSQLLVEWGQYIDHDITFTPQSAATAECQHTCKNHHTCFPIQTEESFCLPFRRSAPHRRAGNQTSERQQLNAITSYIDASLVYGHSPHLQDFLRNLSAFNGKLNVNQRFRDPNGRDYLPFVAETPSACRTAERVECFSAGDSRVNEGLPLIALHTLWLRQHNRIAQTLGLINQHWNPETVYQETRKIVGALHQIITFRDYVPKILGAEAFERYVGPYGGYDPAVDGSASNVFATAAFRFGHGTIAAVVSRLNSSFQEHQRFPQLRLHQTFFSPWRIVREGGIEPTLRGMIGTAAAAGKANGLLVEEVTERLVVLDSLQQMDLGSLNLQRGRDHGLPGYNAWRRFCGLTEIRDLSDLAEAVGDFRVAEKILKTYKHPDNVDVWLGGLVENFLPGSRTGPLFACLIGKQMKSLRDGDRFWWKAANVFSQQQKDELWKVSLSRVICDNTDIDEMPANPFSFSKYPHKYLSCNFIPMMNLEAWREAESPELNRCGSPRRINNGDYLLFYKSGKLTALYSCFHGFKLEGSAETVCVGNEWSGKVPECKGRSE